MALTSALAAAGVGSLAQIGGAVLAAADTTPSAVAPWLQGGGSAAAVAGLVYIARMIAQGKLVPRPVALYEQELNAGIRAAGEREALAMKLTEEAGEREERAREREQRMLLALGRNTKMLEDVSAELRKRRATP